MESWEFKSFVILFPIPGNWANSIPWIRVLLTVPKPVCKQGKRDRITMRERWNRDGFGCGELSEVGVDC